MSKVVNKTTKLDSVYGRLMQITLGGMLLFGMLLMLREGNGEQWQAYNMVLLTIMGLYLMVTGMILRNLRSLAKDTIPAMYGLMLFAGLFKYMGM